MVHACMMHHSTNIMIPRRLFNTQPLHMMLPIVTMSIKTKSPMLNTMPSAPTGYGQPKITIRKMNGTGRPTVTSKILGHVSAVL